MERGSIPRWSREGIGDVVSESNYELIITNYELGGEKNKLG